MSNLRDQLFADHIRQLANSGMSLEAAATRCGMRYQTFRRHAIAADVKFVHGLRRGPGGREAIMRALYLDGYTLQQIGQQFGLTRERVRQLLTKHFGITATAGGHAVAASRKAAISQPQSAISATCLSLDAVGKSISLRANMAGK